MNFLIKKIKNYPISVTYIIIIWVLCFMDVPETPLDNVRFIDKWTHIVMYLGTCLTIWFEYIRSHTFYVPRMANHISSYKVFQPNWSRLIIWSWLMPALMSGIIEVLQAYCTGGRRSGDWMDFYANTAGCTIALIIGYVIAKKRARH